MWPGKVRTSRRFLTTNLHSNSIRTCTRRHPHSLFLTCHSRQMGSAEPWSMVLVLHSSMLRKTEFPTRTPTRKMERTGLMWDRYIRISNRQARSTTPGSRGRLTMAVQCSGTKAPVMEIGVEESWTSTTLTGATPAAQTSREAKPNSKSLRKLWRWYLQP